MTAKEKIPESSQEENEELYEHFRFTVDPGQSLLRIDKYLVNKIENASSRMTQLERYFVTPMDGGSSLRESA